jgi:hypothetical protein
MTTQIRQYALIIVAAMSLLLAGVAAAERLDESLSEIESRWATATYETAGRQKGQELRELLDDARNLHTLYPHRPEAAAWHGIVARSYMDIKGSMSLAREARDALLDAESIDPLALDGQVYAELGALYSKVSSKLGGFGSKTRGIGYFWKALTVDPDGIDTNYLYAEAMVSEKNYAAARDALLRAKESPARLDHPKADHACQQKATILLSQVERKIEELS